jgi:putative hydrolase of the HAD superfamily
VLAQSRGIIWDFDGTLARRSKGWSAIVLDVLSAEAPGHGLTLGQIRGVIAGIWPWDEWQTDHLELAEPGRWWEWLGLRVAKALGGLGVEPALARRVADGLAEEYPRPECWTPFADAAAALDLARDSGWRVAILSNHCPELPRIVSALPFADRLDAVLTSATLGYNKPHPRAFEAALVALVSPEAVWMVGDDVEADISGAASMGIPGILVHKEAPGVVSSPDLLGAVRLIVDRA